MTTITAARAAWLRPVIGLPEAPIMVLCDPQSADAVVQRRPMGPKNFNYLMAALERAGLMPGMFQFVGLCPPIPEAASSSAKKTWDFVSAHLEGLDQLIANRNPRLIIPVGGLALRAIVGKATAITKVRGICQEQEGRLVYPVLSPGFILKVPEHDPTFQSDFRTLRKIVDAGFDAGVVRGRATQYEWRDDISDLLGDLPNAVGLDTETTGLKWYARGTKLLTVQIATGVGRTLIVPVDSEYRRRWGLFDPSLRAVARTRDQLRQLASNRAVRKVGHNWKFDHHIMREAGMEVEGWDHDSQLLAFAVDENMQNKGLDDCVKRWVPEMAGYADAFNATTNKNDMMNVPPEDVLDAAGNIVTHGMRNYAGGDPDAVVRLCQVLVPMLREDPAQYNCYRRIMLPGITAFARTVERIGQVIDRPYLRKLEAEISTHVDKEFQRLIKLVPPAVRQKHIALAAAKKVPAEEMLKFSRDDFMRDVLFTKEGFNLKPRAWTDTTAHLPEAERIPSVSTKTHMPFFEDAKGAAGEFVRGYIAYQKAQKLLTTYIGQESAGTGFWKYISDEGRIHPSYMLHRTNTGRTASADPNGQNIPKRGEFAETYNRSFRASPGFVRVNCDLSQIELRLVAWMAQEQEMLRIYREGGDIHSISAQTTLKMTDEQWAAQSKKDKKLNRFRGKALNFGFIYGMQWRGFKTYAKTTYSVDYTDAEAQEARGLFFQKYPGLIPWHDRMRGIVHRHGSVRALHGAVRRLPSIYSNDESTVSMAERQSVNAPIQRFGSDLGVIAMGILERHADPEILRPVGFIHDCLATEARIGYEDEAASAVKWIMENIPLERYFGIRPPLPIISDAEVEYIGEPILDAEGKVLVDTGDLVERASAVRGANGTLPQIEARVPWFWKDEVEEEFETFMTATGCKAFVPYQPLGAAIPQLQFA